MIGSSSASPAFAASAAFTPPTSLPACKQTHAHPESPEKKQVHADAGAPIDRRWTGPLGRKNKHRTAPHETADSPTIRRIAKVITQKLTDKYPHNPSKSLLRNPSLEIPPSQSLPPSRPRASQRAPVSFNGQTVRVCVCACAAAPSLCAISSAYDFPTNADTSSSCAAKGRVDCVRTYNMDKIEETLPQALSA
jgi:hypothetical protein